jgi:tRNA(fMet)-specific endonuclease VapC
VTRLLLEATFLVDQERGGMNIYEAVLEEDDVAIAAVAVAELETGVHLASENRRAQRQAFVDRIVESVEVVPYDLEVAREHGHLIAHTRRSGRRRGHHDLMVAATAATSDRVVVSADQGAFEDLPGVVFLRSPCLGPDLASGVDGRPVLRPAHLGFEL